MKKLNKSEIIAKLFKTDENTAEFIGVYENNTNEYLGEIDNSTEEFISNYFSLIAQRREAKKASTLGNIDTKIKEKEEEIITWAENESHQVFEFILKNIT